MRKLLRAEASGSVERAVSLSTTATPTATMQPAVMTSIQVDAVSVPVPRPWTTPTGQAAYVSQWIAARAAGMPNPTGCGAFDSADGGMFTCVTPPQNN